MGHASVRAGLRGARRTGQSAASDERQRAVVGDSGDETAPGRAHRCRQLIAPSPMPSISDRTASGTDGTSNALPPTAPRFQPAPSRTSTAAIPRMPPWSTRPPRIPIRRAGRSRSSRPRTGPPGRRATPRRARARTCPRRTRETTLPPRYAATPATHADPWPPSGSASDKPDITAARSTAEPWFSRQLLRDGQVRRRHSARHPLLRPRDVLRRRTTDQHGAPARHRLRHRVTHSCRVGVGEAANDWAASPPTGPPSTATTRPCASACRPSSPSSASQPAPRIDNSLSIRVPQAPSARAVTDGTGRGSLDRIGP